MCIYIYMYLTTSLSTFTCQWTYRLLPCLAIINNTAVNTGVPASFSFMVFSGYISSSGIAGPYSSVIPKEISILFSTCVSVYIPIKSKMVPFGPWRLPFSNNKRMLNIFSKTWLFCKTIRPLQC